MKEYSNKQGHESARGKKNIMEKSGQKKKAREALLKNKLIWRTNNLPIGYYYL